MAADTLPFEINPDYGTKARLTALMLFCISVAGLIICRAAYVQIFSNPKLEKLAQRQYHTQTLIRPRRGTIFDRNGETLAVSIETKSLAANPGKVQNKFLLAKTLSKIIGLPQKKILLKLNEEREFVWIKRHITDQEMAKFKKHHIIDGLGDLISGLWLVNESDRVYPHHQLASHLLGDVNVDSEGIEGIELWMNEKLRGQIGAVAAIKDALGRPTFIDTAAAKNIRDGEPVHLTIDASLQFEVEQHLRSAMKSTSSKSGTVIVMNADTGEILALTNQPTFNANTKRGQPDARRNRAVTDGYEPGSTFKAILAASAFLNGWKSNDQIYGELGSFSVQGHKISEAEAREKFGWISLKKMIKYSSNIAAAKLAMKLGPDKFLSTIRLFGFGTKTGIPFPGEISGRVPTRKQLTPLTLANVGFGQGILVTPLQMTRAYAAIVNGGWLVSPTLFKNADLKNSKEREIQASTRIFPHYISRHLIDALEEVTKEGGTGIPAALPGFRIAGKTGTAQMVDKRTRRYSREKYIASFIGFAVGVEPKIVIYVSLTEPKGKYYATQTAAPLFREVLASVSNYCSLPAHDIVPSKLLAHQLLAQQQEQGVGQGLGQGVGLSGLKDEVRISQSAVSLTLTSDNKLLPQYQPSAADDKAGAGDRKPSGWVMPSLAGLSPREVFQILQGHHFKVEIHGTGVVAGQIPIVGNTLADGDVIRLKLQDP